MMDIKLISYGVATVAMVCDTETFSADYRTDFPCISMRCSTVVRLADSMRVIAGFRADNWPDN